MSDAQPASDYTAVIMDFGSARLRRVVVETRAQALMLQEDAEVSPYHHLSARFGGEMSWASWTSSLPLFPSQANMTATFRAPEWFDMPSPSELDAAASDVWAAGCTLFALMYGQSPFQIAINQVGGQPVG